MFLARLVGAALGLLMVPLMLGLRNRPAWLFRPWHDPTGVAPWWSNYLAGNGNFISRRFPNFWWSAIRNPANGLRTYKWMSCDVDVTRLEWKDNDAPTNPGPLRRAGKRLGWFYAWQGPYSGLWLCFLWNKERHAKVRIGWKLVPDEPQYIGEWKPIRAGFALSILPYRKG